MQGNSAAYNPASSIAGNEEIARTITSLVSVWVYTEISGTTAGFIFSAVDKEIRRVISCTASLRLCEEITQTIRAIIPLLTYTEIRRTIGAVVLCEGKCLQCQKQPI